MSEMFWFQHPKVLIKDFELWPSEDMVFNRKLNAMSRLVILLTVLGFWVYSKLTFFNGWGSNTYCHRLFTQTEDGVRYERRVFVTGYSSHQTI